MTRKDYVLIAAALKSSQLEQFRDGAQPFQHEVSCKRVADALATDNPRFDRDRFLKACGVQS